MRFRDKIGPLHHPIPKPADLPDFLAVARTRPTISPLKTLQPGFGITSRPRDRSTKRRRRSGRPSGLWSTLVHSDVDGCGPSQPRFADINTSFTAPTERTPSKALVNVGS